MGIVRRMGKGKPSRGLAAAGVRARLWRCAWWLVPAIIAVCMSAPKMWQGDWRVDMGLYAGVGYQSWVRVFDGDFSGLYALTEATDPSGEYAVPYFNKPPLPLLVHGLALHTTGLNLWGTRLPSVLVLVGCVVLTAQIARTLMGRRAALAAGLVAATSVPLTTEATVISLDLWQLMFILTCLSLVSADAVRGCPPGAARGRPWRTLAGGATIGLALLCKPLVALLSVPLIAGWLLAIGRGRLVTWLTAGVALGLALPLAFYLLAYGHWGRAFIDEHFGHQIIDRAEARLDNRRAGAGSPLFYVEYLLTRYWPWLITLAFSIWACVRRRLTGRAQHPVWLATILGVGWLAACSMFADKRPRYILPCYPVWAISSAAWMTWLAPLAMRRAWREAIRWAVPAALIAALAVSLLPITVHAPPGAPWAGAMAHVREAGDSVVVHAVGLSKYDRCRFLMNQGRWPAPLSTSRHELMPPPSAGVMLYDTDARWAPGQGEQVMYAAGDYIITRLTGPWQPVRRPDK